MCVAEIMTADMNRDNINHFDNGKNSVTNGQFLKQK